MQDLCKQDPKSICKVGKYNFPSSNAFVGVKQTTLVGFVGFTSFLQTYCHNLQCLSLMKHCQHKCEQMFLEAETNYIFFSQAPQTPFYQAVSKFPL